MSDTPTPEFKPSTTKPRAARPPTNGTGGEAPTVAEQVAAIVQEEADTEAAAGDDDRQARSPRSEGRPPRFEGRSPRPSAVPPQEPTSAKKSIFADLAKLRSRTASALVTPVKLMTHIAIRKPMKHEWIRAHPDPDLSLVASVYEDKIAGETFFVDPDVEYLLDGYLKPVLLRLFVTRQHVIAIWPLAIPDATSPNAYHITAVTAAKLAEKQWVQLKANKPAGCYDVSTAPGSFAEPVWPEKLDFSELLELGFKGRLIDNEDHTVVRSLLGYV